jgi:hypothetical protein
VRTSSVGAVERVGDTEGWVGPGWRLSAAGWAEAVLAGEERLITSDSGAIVVRQSGSRA